MSTTPSTSSPASSSKYLPAPSPWPNMTCEAFWFLTHLSPRVHAPTGTLAPSFYHATELLSHTSALNGSFVGGLGTVMIIRYTSTPVGPYDELIFVPGNFTAPGSTTAKRRVTRIYISSPRSVFSGRKNWNIPKTLAEFTFTPAAAGGRGYSRVEVRPYGEGEGGKPFFACDMNCTMPWLPFSTAWVPAWLLDLGLVQPPLPSRAQARAARAKDVTIDERMKEVEVDAGVDDDGMLAGTEKWWGIDPLMRGTSGVCFGSGGLEGGLWGDGKGWPSVGMWSVGVWWPKMLIDFPVGREVVVNVKAQKDR